MSEHEEEAEEVQMRAQPFTDGLLRRLDDMKKMNNAFSQHYIGLSWLEHIFANDYISIPQYCALSTCACCWLSTFPFSC